MKQSRRDATQCDMGFRSLEVRAATFSEETRSVEAVISTETPVAMPDWHRMEMIPEVLVASGAEYPGNRQVPFLDSHQRRSVKDQLGSARDITVDGNQITAKLVFRKASESEEALAGVRDGHITDVSVGYEVLKRQYVASGDKKTIAGRSYEGPVNVVTKWRLREVSLTPIGADAQAKLRGLDPAAVRFQSSEKENFQMNPELRKMLESRGMPATLTDDEAQRWLVENTDKLAPAKQEEQRQEQGQTIDARSLQKMIAEATAEAIKQETAARAAFEKEVASLCELAGLPDAAAHCRTLSNVDDVRNYLKAEKAKDEAVVPFGSAVRFVSAGADRLKNGIRGALINKAVRYAVNDNQHMLDRYLTPEQRTDKDAENFRHATLLDMATEFVRSLGIQTLGMTREDIAICAMFGPEKAGIRGFRGDNPYHTTGSFANLTLDAINKSMMVGYQEVPATWRGPMRQGESVADFKQINRLRLGGIPNLPVWNDVDEPSKASFADAKESYAVEARSIGVDFSYKLLVNDDMSALTRVPLSLGDAAARTVNAVAWSQITSNPTMADGVALFAAATGARKRTNLTTGSGAPSVSTLGTLTNLMRQMRGENTPDANEGPDILNLQPSYLVVPSALETTALQLVNSAYDPSASVNNTVYNPARTLTPVIEPLLDANSTTAWYLFAAPVRIDTVEVTFLQGQETPQVRSVMDEHTLAMTYYVLQSVAAKALNHRGVQRHNNA